MLHLGQSPAPSYSYSITNNMCHCYILLQVVKKLVIKIQIAFITSTTYVKKDNFTFSQCIVYQYYEGNGHQQYQYGHCHLIHECDLKHN